MPLTEIFDLLREQLLSEKQIKTNLRKRKLEYFEKSVKHALVDECVEDGWELVKTLKYKARLRKNKPVDVYFEDQLWKLFADLGYHALNRDRKFSLPYSKDESLTQQIDVFAADDDTVVIVECKATELGPKCGKFKKHIEAIGGEKSGLIASAKKLLGNDRLKVVFILATHGYYLSDPDKERLANFGIHYFDNEAVAYYQELVKHLGTAARYQLEANLFPGQKIPSIDTRVPAIRGKMGGHTYYSFMSEPEKLLKVGFVLHRSKANKKLMPTYQRLIKKSRLRAIRKFVDEGGFFANSIIVNIEGTRAPKFDLASNQIDGSDSKVGILHLPQKYRSLFIIDGQHRLYGYSDTQYAKRHTIPVVAFLNLQREEQVRLFMEINENQKAVPKNLRHTLNADLQWESEYVSERVNALKLTIAQHLGEEMSSPLYDRIVVGENTRTETRNITLEAIKQGLDKGNFFGEFTRTSIKRDGTFFSGDNEAAYNQLFPFLVEMFTYVQVICEDEWNRLAKDGGLLLINMGVNSLLRLFSDVLDHVVKEDEVNPKYDPPEEIAEACASYLDPLHHYFKELKDEERETIRKKYGTGGPVRFWRVMQKVLANSIKGFEPQGMEQYWLDESKAFNTKSFELIRDIEELLNRDFQERLKMFHGKVWFKKGVPFPVYESSTAMAAKKNREITEGPEKEPWDCLHITDYRKIATSQGNWKNIFEDAYTRPGEEKISGGAQAKTKWLDKLNRIRNATDHEYSVKRDEFEFLQEIHDWLVSSGEASTKVVQISS